MAPISASASETKNISDASSAWMTATFNTPFSFDNSGWNVSIGSNGPMTASGATGQGSGTGGGLGASMTPNMRLLLLAVAAYFILRK